MRQRGFQGWWDGIKSHPTEKRQDIVTNWLKYACKTVSFRGNHDEQKIVYTITERYRRSTHKRLSKYNAKTVYNIVNKKQERFRAEKKGPGLNTRTSNNST